MRSRDILGVSKHHSDEKQERLGPGVHEKQILRPGMTTVHHVASVMTRVHHVASVMHAEV